MKFNTMKTVVSSPYDKSFKTVDAIVWKNKLIKPNCIQIQIQLIDEDGEHASRTKVEQALKLPVIQNGKHGDIVESVPETVARKSDGVYQIIEDKFGEKSIIPLAFIPVHYGNLNPIGTTVQTKCLKHASFHTGSEPISVDDFLRHLVVEGSPYVDKYSSTCVNLHFYDEISRDNLTFIVNLEVEDEDDNNTEQLYNELLLQLRIMNMYRHCYIYIDRQYIEDRESSVSISPYSGFIIYTSIPDKDNGIKQMEISMSNISTYMKTKKNIGIAMDEMEKRGYRTPEDIQKELMKYLL